MKKAEYMESHIGETFEGIISGVQEFGLFVELPNTVEGLVKIDDMPKGGYVYLEDCLCLMNRNSKERYSFGDSVIVKLISANKETSMIDFAMVSKKKLED